MLGSARLFGFRLDVFAADLGHDVVAAATVDGKESALLYSARMLAQRFGFTAAHGLVDLFGRTGPSTPPRRMRRRIVLLGWSAAARFAYRLQLERVRQERRQVARALVGR